eukprot:Selendium_serpulae@DN6915_c0_g1_i1.p3
MAPLLQWSTLRLVRKHADALAPLLAAAALRAATEGAKPPPADAAAPPDERGGAAPSLKQLSSDGAAALAAAEAAGVLDSTTALERLVVAPMFGYASPADLHHSNSSARFVRGVAAPLLVVQAQDDPFVDGSAFERILPNLKPNIAFVESKAGSHLAYIEGMTLKQWLPPLSMDFITEVLREGERFAAQPTSPSTDADRRTDCR